MKKTDNSNAMPSVLETDSRFSRRNFLAFSGMAVVSATLVSSCKGHDDNPTPAGTVNLGSGDIGILNYAYALEQLEAAFYTQVALSFYTNATQAEKTRFIEIRDHEIAHREFFKNALGSNAIGNLEVDFSKINFTDRSSVLNTAKAFEDLGVSAYNGAGQLLQSSDYLLLAGKIVSVEARHAAYIRDIISNGSFANSEVVDANGLDVSRSPAEVLSIAKTYLKTVVSGNNLPTS